MEGLLLWRWAEAVQRGIWLTSSLPGFAWGYTGVEGGGVVLDDVDLVGDGHLCDIFSALLQDLFDVGFFSEPT